MSPTTRRSYAHTLILTPDASIASALGWSYGRTVPTVRNPATRPSTIVRDRVFMDSDFVPARCRQCLPVHGLEGGSSSSTTQRARLTTTQSWMSMAVTRRFRLGMFTTHCRTCLQATTVGTFSRCSRKRSADNVRQSSRVRTRAACRAAEIATALFGGLGTRNAVLLYHRLPSTGLNILFPDFWVVGYSHLYS